MFYYFPHDCSKGKKEFVYFDAMDIKELKGVSMNQQYVFFWNLGSAWKLSLLTNELSKLSFYISEEEKETKIKKLSTGSDPNIVTVRVRQSTNKDFLIVWDLQMDIEINSIDIDSEALFFQDQHGKPYLVEKDYVLICSQGTRIKSYNMKVSDFDTENVTFKFGYGKRVDISHNWIIFRNFINLSFSYMTFVIKENFDKNGYIQNDF